MTPNGQLVVSWLKKISEYKEDERVTLTISDRSNNETREIEGRAIEVRAPSLKLGNIYEMALKSQVDGEEIVGPIEFEACEY